MAGDRASPWGLGVDEQNVYWEENVNETGNVTLVVIPEAGGKVTVLASSLTSSPFVRRRRSGVYYCATRAFMRLLRQ
jgi:hypothetical protein